jgi:hypothetical protein
MISDRDRQILAEAERQLRLEDLGLARQFEETTPGGVGRRLGTRSALVATSMPVMIALLLLLVGSMVIGLGMFTLALVVLTTTSICFRIRRERDE